MRNANKNIASAFIVVMFWVCVLHTNRKHRIHRIVRRAARETLLQLSQDIGFTEQD